MTSNRSSEETITAPISGSLIVEGGEAHLGVGVEERGRFLEWILRAGLENFYFANFGGNVILFLLLKKIEENELGGVGRRKIYANSGRGSAVFCATAL